MSWLLARSPRLAARMAEHVTSASYDTVTAIDIDRYLEVPVLVSVSLEEAFDGAPLISELRLGQIRAEGLQHLGDVLHGHCKAFYRLRGAAERARIEKRMQG